MNRVKSQEDRMLLSEKEGEKTKKTRLIGRAVDGKFDLPYFSNHQLTKHGRRAMYLNARWKTEFWADDTLLLDISNDQMPKSVGPRQSAKETLTFK